MSARKELVMRTRRPSALVALLALVIGPLILDATAQGTPEGEMVLAWHVTIAPAWFDPIDTPAQITPYGALHALHDALVRPLPGEKMGNSLAEAWTESPDGRVYEFKLREGLKFHNGDPFTAEDVKFSFERYRGVGANELHAKVKAAEVIDPHRVRFVLHDPWPDFMTFYGTTATAAGIVVPKHYLEQVGEEGFKRHPIGLGPYRFVSHTPGVEVVLEAYEGYWRRVPHVKRLIMKGIPEVATRLAMLKKSEADIAFALEGPVAEEVKRDPHLQLIDTRHPSINWIEFPEQWDPKSP
jgi:peptide/nickel transport system substrate-binding protein